MPLGSKDVDINNINCDHFSQADFYRWDSDDIFEVADYFWAFLADAEKKGYMVYGQPIMTAPKTEFDVYIKASEEVRKFLNFCSYNYLGYSYRPEVQKAVKDAINVFGTGAVSAPLLSGYYEIHWRLEQELAKLKGKEDAMVYSSGYGTNLGVISGLLGRGDMAVLDRLSHASIYDGVRLSGADLKVFAHNDPEELEKVLKNLTTKRVLVCLEGVYSMDGDLANLPEIVPVCKKYGAKILLDEAHSSLIFGKKGAGVGEHFGLEDQIDISIGTFSKSFGAIGGFAVASQKVITYLKMYARSFLFSCAMAPHTAAGILKVLELFQNDKSDLKKLWENSRYMWNKLKEIDLDIGNTKSQVVPVMAGNDLRLREISKRLFERGLYTGFVTFPAVPRNSTRLRLSISSAHTKEQMDKASSILKEVYAEVK